jgi:5-methylcytosine-specific restriction endonuclease McrA
MWSRKSDCCVRCGTTAVRHGGAGLCMSCYQKDWAIRQGAALRRYKQRWYEESKKRIDYRAKNQRHRNGPVDAVLARFGHKCSLCGAKKHLQIHHKDHKGHNVPKRDRNNSIENLQVLCRACHGRLHGTVEEWSRKHTQCVDCGTTERKHHAHGRCARCHLRAERQRKV